MAGFDDLGDGVRKLFLVGVGAVATGAEKSTEIVNKLVEKGELTVAQGKAVNEELKHTIKNAAGDTSEAVLRAKLKAMTPDDARGARGLGQERPEDRRRPRCRAC